MKIISGNKKANGYARYKKFVDVLYESGKIDLKRRSELLKKASTLLNEGLLDKGKEFLAKKTKGALEGAAGGDVMEKAGEQAGKVFSGIMGGLVSELMKDESFKATIKDMTKNMDLSQMKEMAREMAPEMKEMIKDNVEMAAAREGIEEGEEGDEERGLIQEEDEGGEETLNESLNNFEEIRARFKQALIKRKQNLANKEGMKESHNRNDRRRYVKEDLVHDPIRGNYEDPDFHAAGPLDEEDFERSMYHHAYPGTAPGGKPNIMKSVFGKWAAAGEKERIYDILNSKEAYELLKMSPDMFDHISDEDLEDLYMGCPQHMRACGILRDEREKRSKAGWTEEREAYANMMTESKTRLFEAYHKEMIPIYEMGEKVEKNGKIYIVSAIRDSYLPAGLLACPCIEYVLAPMDSSRKLIIRQTPDGNIKEEFAPIQVPVQINRKLAGVVDVYDWMDEKSILDVILDDSFYPKLKAKLAGQKIINTEYVPGKILSLITETRKRVDEKMLVPPINPRYLMHSRNEVVNDIKTAIDNGDVQTAMESWAKLTQLFDTPTDKFSNYFTDEEIMWLRTNGILRKLNEARKTKMTRFNKNKGVLGSNPGEAGSNISGVDRMDYEDNELVESSEYMSRKYPARLSNEKAPAIDTLPGKGENLSKERLRNYLANKKKRVMEAQKKNLKLKKK